jgi:hypothetical protein
MLKSEKNSTNRESTGIKLIYNDITLDHECIVKDRKSDIEKRCPKSRKTGFKILTEIVASKNHVDSKRFFKSNKRINQEIFEHMTSNHWYIIHPFSNFRLYWNSLMILILYAGFVYYPLRFAFWKFLKGTNANLMIMIFLNSFFALDVLLSFFTGFKNEKNKTVTLDHLQVVK